MTAPAPSGGPSPLRVGGLALLGVGAVAAIIGLATLAMSGDDGQVAAPAPSASATPDPSTPPPSDAAASPTAAAPLGEGAVPVPSFGSTPTNGLAAPPGTPPPAAAGGDGSGAGSSGGGAATIRGPIRVYNNSTIPGLAARAAQDFRSAGWEVGQVANYPSGIIPTSTVYYRPGTAEQQAAQAMGDGFGLRVEKRFDGLDEASPGLIVIVTNDYQRA